MKRKKVNIKTVKPESDEKVVEKVKKEKLKKEKKLDLEKREKVNKVLDEIKAFLMIDLIVFIVAFSGWYWYTHFYNDAGHESLIEEKEVMEYKVSKYTIADKHHLKVLNDRYVIEYNDNMLYKVMDMKNNVLYEGEMEYTDIYVGIDNELYIIESAESEDTNQISIYTLKDKSYEEVKKLSENGTYYAPIKYYKDKNAKEYYLLGFTAVKSVYDEEMREVNKSYIYTLAGSEMELNDYQLFGDSISLKESAREIITFDPRYIVINGITSDTKSYGLYDLESKKVVIKPQYEGLYTNKDDEYIAIKNGKYGIINKSLKKIVDFQYDFIDKNDEYYIIAIDNKMAVMDENYQMITEAVFDYQNSSDNILYNYLNDGLYYNTFYSRKVGDHYILVVNNKELMENLEYDIHETYIINGDGTYKVISENEFYVDDYSSLIYSYDKDSKVYTFYDVEMNEKFKIDISGYDYDKRAEVSLINENTIVIKLDSEVYYSYEDGKEIDQILDYQDTNNGVQINYSSRDKEVVFSTQDTELARVNFTNVDHVNNYFVTLSEDAFYFATEEIYLIVYRGE